MTNKPATFISFCVDIGRGDLPQNNNVYRSFELYKLMNKENLITNLPLVLHSSLDDLELPSNRNEENFKHYLYNTKDIESEFPNFDLYKNNYKKTKKDNIESALFYYNPLVVSKMDKVINCIDLNPFGSDYFFWIDCSFTRGLTDVDFLYNESSYLDMVKNVKNKIGDKFLLLNFGPRPLGFFWGGSKMSIKNVYKHYYDIYFESLSEKMLTEELIFKEIWNRYPELMYIVDVDPSVGYKKTCQDFLLK